MVIVLADPPALSPEPFTGLTGTDIVLRSLAIDPAEVHFVDVGSATGNVEAQAAAQIAAAIDTSLDRPYAWAGAYVGLVGKTFTLDGRGSDGIASLVSLRHSSP